MRRVAGSFLLIGAAALVGCNIDESGLATSSGDAALEAALDARSEPGEASACADAGTTSCGDAGFGSPALYSPDAGAPCPAGYDTLDLAYAVPQSATCTCECNDAGPPACDTSTFHYGSGAGSCTQLTGAVGASPTCAGLAFVGVAGASLEIDPPAVVGGCAGGTSLPPSLTATDVRLCVPQCASDESVCQAQNGLEACVYVAGDAPSCPAAYPTGPFYVGSSPSVQCDSCSCSSQGDCTASVLHLYTSNNCGAGDKTFAMDGTCSVIGGGNAGTFFSAKIDAKISGFTCNVTPGAAHTSYAASAFTVCCK